MSFLLQHCQISFAQHGGLLMTLFMGGLVGGFTHCSGMCGPFVMSQTAQIPSAAASSNLSLLQRASGLTLLPYHAGRMTTYVILGVLAALLSMQIMGSPLQQGIAALFLVLAGVIFILSALPSAKQLLRGMRIQGLEKFGEWLGVVSKPLFNKPIGLQGYLLGVMLGLLPCGLVFASLMAISTTGNVTTAVMGMVLFTVGTVPALFLVGAGGRVVFMRWPTATQKIARGVMVFNGISLFVMAGNIVF